MFKNSNFKELLFRFIYYLVGLTILAFGLTLNTKTGFGASPIITIPFSISHICGINIGNITMIMYVLFIIVQLLLRDKKQRVLVLLQLPLAFVFTRFLNLFSILLPGPSSPMWLRILMLLGALIFSGIGAAMSLNMQLVPNPADGIVQAIADKTGKSVGFCKNIFDTSCVILAVVICLVSGNPILGVGIGTLLSMIVVGRVISVFNLLTEEKSRYLAGLDSE
ncbi:MAG TPA: hypothetical protein GX717_00020 [Clostridiaceae bacterium]|nr:hypothetical protein [Clostridiaceae bacterium]